MKIALIGATGQVGSRILDEALGRGHQVTAIARKPQSIAARTGLTTLALDVSEGDKLASALAGQDAVVISVKYSQVDPRPLFQAAKNAGVARLLVVGGAGSLQVAPGVDLVDTPDFPAPYKPEALAARDFLNLLRQESVLDWSFLSPSALLQPGERTGQFRLGGDQLLTDAKGASRISLEDLALALVDELEQPRHSRRRFTVGY
jgi:putative NADH-flavin reductase